MAGSSGRTVADRTATGTWGRILCVAAVTLLVLTGCGGDGEGDGGEPLPAPARVPDSALPANQRIESLDTAQQKNAPAPVWTGRAVSRLPAAAVVAHVALPPLLRAKAQDGVGEGGWPMRIGVARAVDAAATPDAMAPLLHWELLPDGAQVAAVEFVADGAQALRLGLLVQQLPDDTVLRFRGSGEVGMVAVTAAELARLHARNMQAGLDDETARLYWSPVLTGATARLEVELPPGADPTRLRLALPRLSHFTQAPERVTAKAETDPGASDSCNQDVLCQPGWDAQSRAVARLFFTRRDGSSFWCSGTLLNDVRGSRTPFLLTAEHCIANQTEAASLLTRWFFRAASCGGTTTDSRETELGGGADLLLSDSASDSALLRLRRAPPADVVYAGSYFGSEVVEGMPVLGIHHPLGDVQKASSGMIDGRADCVNGRCVDADDGAMLRVRWTLGSTAGGSSGSALFATLEGRHYVAATLFGGNASCENPDGADYYGRFDRAFDAGMRDWLAAQ